MPPRRRAGRSTPEPRRRSLRSGATPARSRCSCSATTSERASSATTLRDTADFPPAVADALVEIAGTDRVDYQIALEDILDSFERRTDFLEDIPVADTVLVLQRLAAARDLAVDLEPSAVLP